MHPHRENVALPSAAGSITKGMIRGVSMNCQSLALPPLMERATRHPIITGGNELNPRLALQNFAQRNLALDSFKIVTRGSRHNGGGEVAKEIRLPAKELQAFE